MCIEPVNELVREPSSMTLQDLGEDSAADAEVLGDVGMKETLESVGNQISSTGEVQTYQTSSRTMTPGSQDGSESLQRQTPSTLTPEAEMLSNSRDTTLQPQSPPSSIVKEAATAVTRFISSFRGRVIQGIKVELPLGYIGLVLRDEKEDMKTDAKGKSRGKGKTKEPVKDKVPQSQGRTTRSTNRTQKVVAMSQTVEDDAMDVGEEKWEMPNDVPERTFVPTSRFSSLILWHADIPADGGRDEYFRALNEWTRLAHEVCECSYRTSY